ncbi:fimbrial assembly protein [Deinococcus radiomollis]|uniref:fimbrial assembly protein n=1 Tax=Deinococcus radiomollis TaxID=468916 RepID=UPI003891EDEB
MVEINLLPAQYRKRSDPSLWRYGSLALPVLTVLGILAFTVTQNTRLGNIQASLDETNGQISALASAKKEYDDLNRQKTELQQVTVVSRSLQASKTYWSSDLARFVNALPTGGGVALSALSVKAVDSNALTNYAQQGLYNGKAVSKEFELTGQAVSSQALVNFLNSFENNPNFGVNFKSAQRQAVSGTVPAGGNATAATNTPYTFSATVGLIGQATAASATTGTAGAPGTVPGPATSTPAAGSSNVR